MPYRAIAYKVEKSDSAVVKHRLSEENAPIIPSPATVHVDYERKPILYLPNGKGLVRKVGY